ncbi:hypothetical protein [Chryseobacterium sp. KMC2]|uniref:hypothetical protein n=1 Tax=Chryseobacterium sp. KMC2 TaxID=2800705 RepID=UPI0019242BC7|nr:hypothetical protein [Chryseobacterium sp. KMC2]MBL3547559.1 hypothetical protein [Chryseobacterium sp. KMC2]
MAKKVITALKEYFKAGKRPTESQFSDLIDSYANLEDKTIFPDNYKHKDLYFEFPDQQADMAIDVLLGNNYLNGSLVIEVAGTFAYQTSVGIIKKQFEIGLNPDGNLWYPTTSRIVEAEGTILYNIYIGDIVWDSARNEYKLTIYHTSNRLNPYAIRITQFSYDKAFVDQARLSDVYHKPLIGQKKHSVHYNENIGIGTDNPKAKLDVRGTVFAGQGDGTQGINAFAIRYENGSVNNWGSLRSGAETYMSYGAKADNQTAYGWVSGDGTFAGCKTAVTLGNEGIKFLSSNYLQVPQDSPVAMSELMRIVPNGNVGIGTESPQQKLDVHGTILSQINSNEGGALFLENHSKTAPGTANRWALYNMTGGYGNGLQFWSYSADGTYGPKLFLSDAGNMALYGKIEAKDVVITATPTADHVFASDYHLRGIKDLGKFITENNHLPEIPSAKEMTADGLSVGDFQIKLLQKIEEMSLYIISLDKEIDRLKSK